jgi:hypothetical protein
LSGLGLPTIDIYEVATGKKGGKRGQATFSARKKTETQRGQKIRKSSLSLFFISFFLLLLNF